MTHEAEVRHWVSEAHKAYINDDHQKAMMLMNNCVWYLLFELEQEKAKQPLRQKLSMWWRHKKHKTKMKVRSCRDLFVSRWKPKRPSGLEIFD